MITEEQVNKIIELLIKIESNTEKTKINTYDLSSVVMEIEEIKKHLFSKKH